MKKLNRLIWLSILAASTAGASQVSKADGTVVEGEILGTVVLATAGKHSYEVVAGKDIEGVDNRGVHLRNGAVVVLTGFPLLTNKAIYLATTTEVFLGAVLPVAAKKEPKEVKVADMFGALLSGPPPDSGIDEVPVGKASAYLAKGTFTPGKLNPVAGELVEKNGTYSIASSLRIKTADGVVSTLAVTSIIPAAIISK